MSHLLAFDAGTGSIRAVLFDLLGNQIAVSQKEWVHKTDPRYPGSMNFDVKENWHLVQQCTKEVLQRSNVSPSSIQAISATSMREGFVLYDKGGQEIWACANVDGRASAEVSELKEIRSHLEEDLYTRSGQTFSLGALPRLLWIKKHEPDVYSNIHSFTMLNDWILYKLSGVLQIDPSNGCTSGIFNLQNRVWDNDVAKECGLALPFSPTVNEAGTVIGTVTKECAALTGLREGIPVVACGRRCTNGITWNRSRETLSNVSMRRQFWQQEVNVTEPITDPYAAIRVNCHVAPNLWQYETIAFFPGLVMRWFRDAFCQEEKKLADKLGVDAYELLEEQAKDVPVGSHGIIPTFSNVMNYISWRHAAPSFLNLSLDADKCGKKNCSVLLRKMLPSLHLVT